MSQVITRQMVADKLAAYLRHELPLADLVAWAEDAMMDGEFERQHFTAIRDVMARLGVADVRAFGLTWEVRATGINKTRADIYHNSRSNIADSLKKWIAGDRQSCPSLERVL